MYGPYGTPVPFKNVKLTASNADRWFERPGRGEIKDSCGLPVFLQETQNVRKACYS